MFNFDSFTSLLPHDKEKRNYETKFQCSMCPYSTHRTTSFKNHKLTHSKERPYKCHICLYGFTTKQNLKRHMVVHLKPVENNVVPWNRLVRPDVHKTCILGWVLEFCTMFLIYKKKKVKSHAEWKKKFVLLPNFYVICYWY